jgi:hypothetical protein
MARELHLGCWCAHVSDTLFPLGWLTRQGIPGGAIGEDPRSVDICLGGSHLSITTAGIVPRTRIFPESVNRAARSAGFFSLGHYSLTGNGSFRTWTAVDYFRVRSEQVFSAIMPN